MSQVSYPLQITAHVFTSWDCFRFLSDCMNNGVKMRCSTVHQPAAGWATRDITWTLGWHCSTRSVTLSGHQGVRSEERNATLMVCITSPVCGQYIKNISSPHKSNAPVTWGSSDLTLLQCCNSSVSANYKLEFLADHWWGEQGSVDFKWPHLWCLFNI